MYNNLVPFMGANAMMQQPQPFQMGPLQRAPIMHPLYGIPMNHPLLQGLPGVGMGAPPGPPQLPSNVAPAPRMNGRMWLGGGGGMQWR